MFTFRSDCSIMVKKTEPQFLITNRKTCYGNTIPGFHEISAPLWSRGQNAFLVIVGPRDQATSRAIETFENLYTGDPQRTRIKAILLTNGCMDVDVKGNIMSSERGKFIIPLASGASKYI